MTYKALFYYLVNIDITKPSITIVEQLWAPKSCPWSRGFFYMLFLNHFRQKKKKI